MSGKKEAIAQYRKRPNAGPTVSVTKSYVPNPDGTTLVQLSLDLSTAPVPERRYFAETGWVSLEGDFVRVMLGQRRFGNASSLRSVVTISLSIEATRNLLKSCEIFIPTAEEFLKKNDLRIAQLEPIQAEPEQAVSVVGNLIAVAHVAREACLDVYHTSPWAIRAVGDGGTDLELDPILRIDLSTMLLVATLLRLKELQLPPEAN